MHHQAHVKTVVVGARLSYGPVQTPGATRGARSYGAGELDQNFALTKVVNLTTVGLLPTRSHEVLVKYAGFNLRDQTRKDQNSIPLQFIYEAAACRIFYTKKTFNNYNLLWRYAPEAIWSDPSKCVEGSTGYARYGPDMDTIGPPQPHQNPDIKHGMPGVVQTGGSYNTLPVSNSRALHDGGTCVQSIQGKACNPIPNTIRSHDCPTRYNCVQAQICNPAHSKVIEFQCWPICFTAAPNCWYGACEFRDEIKANNGNWIGTCPSRPLPGPCGSDSKAEAAALQAYHGSVQTLCP